VKIAYLFERYPSPTETFLAREVEALRRAGVEIEIFAVEAGEGASGIKLPSKALRLLGKGSYWRQTGITLAHQLRASGIGHVHAAWSNHIADLAREAAGAAGLSWSFAAHARDLWVDGGDMKAKLDSALFAVTCTRAGEAHLKKFGPSVQYAPHGLELLRYEWQAWSPPSKGNPYFSIVGVGRLVEKKGWPDAVQAVEMLNARGVHSQLTLVGEGPLRSHLDNKVNLAGSLPHSEAIEVMRRCNCLILPSRRTSDGDRDGLANVLLEAAALGLPIITTSAGSAADFVDESTGLLVEPENPAALCEALLQTLHEPKATAERCRNARARVEADFDVDKNVLPLLRAFETAIS
jgi:colanic acid/amylovoran biosynthesis glycosyltransferase